MPIHGVMESSNARCGDDDWPNALTANTNAAVICGNTLIARESGIGNRESALMRRKVGDRNRNTSRSGSIESKRGIGFGNRGSRFPVPDLVSFSRFLDRLRERRHYVEDIAHNTVIRDLEDGRVLVLVYRHDGS